MRAQGVHRSTVAKIWFSACAATATLAPAVGRAQSSTTQSSIPAAGNSVKSGDVIIWHVNKSITLTNPGTNTPSSTDATAADDLAAANAVQVAAQSAFTAAAFAANNASASDKTTLQAAETAAGSALVKANSDLKAAQAAAAAKPTTSSSTIAAAANIVQTSTTDLANSLKSATQAWAKAAADQKKAADAKNADKTLNDQATASVADAQKADVSVAAAQALLLAAETAYKTVAAVAAKSGPSKVCFPVNSRFDVSNVVAATKSTSGSPGTTTSTSPKSTATADTSASNTSVSVSNTQLVYGQFSQGHFTSFFHPVHNNSMLKDPGSTASLNAEYSCGTDGPLPATVNTPYAFSADQLDQQDFKREGFTWGGMVIPFKFYFKDRSIKSNSSVVGFAGYEGWFPGVSLAAVIAGGLGAGSTTSSSAASTTTGATSSTSTASTSTALTYTVGVGLVATFGGTVKGGLMFGRDYQGNANAFAYENKTWMAFSIGAGF